MLPFEHLKDSEKSNEIHWMNRREYTFECINLWLQLDMAGWFTRREGTESCENHGDGAVP